jgi:hypothetical protein
VAATGEIFIKWKKSVGAHSSGTFSMQLTTMTAVTGTGMIESGQYAGMTVSATVSQQYESCESRKGIRNGAFNASAFEIA